MFPNPIWVNKQTMPGFLKDLKYIGKLGKTYSIILGVILAAFTVLVIYDASVIRNSLNENMLDQGRVISTDAGAEIRSYMQTCLEAVELTGKGVEALIDNGQPSKFIEDSLVIQTNNYLSILGENFTGLYGLVKGEYVDGLGWVPDEDYIPSERPWYIEAVNNPGSIQLVDPYMDSQTKKVVMSASKLLKDGESVVALDFSLDRVREVTEEFVNKGSNNELMLIGDDGTILAHSTQTRQLGNVFSKMELLHGYDMEKLSNHGDDIIKVKFKGKNYAVYADELYDGFYIISAINIDKTLSQQGMLYFFQVLVMIFIWGIMIGLFVDIAKKRTEAAESFSQMYSISGIYTTMDMIDLKADSFQMVRCDGKEMRNSQEGMTVGAQRILRETMWSCSAESSQNKLFKFIDLSTLNERMSDTDTVSLEYLDNNNQWCRGRFTVVKRGQSGKIKSVLWMIEPIDKEKREREHLEWLSETDRLTGIMNRGGGEEKIRQIIENGEKGMLAILDADHFKSINDTFGHQVGDQVIIAIANCMKNSFRDEDVVMRLGGDEFSCFLSGMTDKKHAESVLARFIDNIHAISIPQITDRKIEVSIGAAFLDMDTTKDFESLYKKADRGVYESKKTEGSCVTFIE